MNIEIPSALYTSDVFATVALLLVLLTARLIAGRALRRRDDLSDQVARRWTANFRNVLILVAVIGLVMIWAPQLRTFALSLTAVAVAIVVATKELLLCLSGSAFRTFSRAYTIGDIVQIGSHRGEVSDISLLSTRLREVDQREGSIRFSRQEVVIPHSLLFSNPARTLTKTGVPAEHVFDLVFETDLDLFSRYKELETLAKTAVLKAQAGREPIAAQTPQIAMMTTELGRVRLEVSIATTPALAGLLENEITTAIGSFVYAQAPSSHAS